MKKMTKKNPNSLIDVKFNIPLFNAEKQMYLCIDVSEIATSPGGKDYNISLSEIAEGYSVPQRVDIHLFIPNTDTNGELAHITMNEVRDHSGDIKLVNTVCPKKDITTLEGLKKIFYKMAKNI